MLEILQQRGKYCNAVGNVATTFLLASVAIFPTPLYYKEQSTCLGNLDGPDDRNY